MVCHSIFLGTGQLRASFSYLVLNTAWLKADMKTLVTESSINRWIIFLAGLVLGHSYGVGAQAHLAESRRDAGYAAQLGAAVALRIRALCRLSRCCHDDCPSRLDLNVGLQKPNPLPTPG